MWETCCFSPFDFSWMYTHTLSPVFPNLWPAHILGLCGNLRVRCPERPSSPVQLTLCLCGSRTKDPVGTKKLKEQFDRGRSKKLVCLSRFEMDEVRSNSSSQTISNSSSCKSWPSPVLNMSETFFSTPSADILPGGWELRRRRTPAVLWWWRREICWTFTKYTKVSIWILCWCWVLG